MKLPSLFGDDTPQKARHRGTVEKLNDYAGFTDKFKPKLTTDDCYTPQPVYDYVVKWVNDNIRPLDGLTILRPFKPGGDYEREEYPDNAVVIDNPPFSILSKIVQDYVAWGVPFFLFAPSLTLFCASRFDGVTGVVCGANITYANGAKVQTGFVTNMEGRNRILLDGTLGADLTAISAAEHPKAKMTKQTWLGNVVNAAILTKYCRRGIRWAVPFEEAHFVRAVGGGADRCRLYGGGFLLSDRAAAERAAAERAAAERAAAERAAAERAAAERAAAERAAARRLTLTGEEQNIIKKLSNK